MQDLSELSKEDEILKSELEQKYQVLEDKVNKESFRVFLSGRYDKGGVIFSIYSGAGGVDAQDWVAMLLRMYQRYCESKGFKVKVLHQSFGEPGGPDGRIGVKSVTFEIQGSYAYGFLKKETGVHRLVRISPFSSQKLRHTSFAFVEALPEIIKDEELKIEIKPEDIKIDTFRASGPGGQNVNKRDTAIRIVHLPTKISVSCQSERLQGLNRDKAMKMLRVKLYQIKEKEKEKKLAEAKGEAVSIEWGSQIRSYILHPYQMIKDHRTKVESSNIEEVLDGNLDEFIEAEIKIK